MFKIGDRSIDPSSREVRDGEASLRLSPKAFGVLQALIEAEGGVLSRADLLDAVWPGVIVGEEVLTHAIGELRRALGDTARNSRIIQTVHKSGYRLLLRPEPDTASEPPAELAMGSETAGAHGERKRVTVLAVDLGPAGKRLLEGDAETAEKVFREVAEVVRETAVAHGGTTIRTVNDCHVFLFGAPRALESHVLHACAAALQIRTALGDDADAGEGRCTGDVRFGLSSGEVVVRPDLDRDRHLDIVGAPVSRALEVLAQAAPGTICLDGSSYGSAQGAVIAETHEHSDCFVLHGFSDWSPRPNRPNDFLPSELVGREFELNLLRHAAGLAQTGISQVVAISGEAGIGKSRLYREFLDGEMDDDWRKLRVQIRRTACPPLQGIIDLMHAVFGLSELASNEDANARIRGKLAGLPDHIGPIASLLYLPEASDGSENMEPRERLRRTEEAIAAVLIAEAARRPVVIVVEDLHWASEETIGVLGNILPALRHHRILLLLNWRADFHPAHTALASATHHRMEALSETFSAKVLRRLLGASKDMQSVGQLLVDRCRGNPLFLEECVLALSEAGVIVGQAGHYRLGTSELNFVVPSSVHEILAARIDRLNPQDKSLVQACAVIGTEAELDEICELAGLSTTDALEGLHRLSLADLIHKKPDQQVRSFVFKHSMTHEVAYFGLLRDRRVSLHKTLAEYLEAKRGRQQPESSAVIAHHWTAADEIEQAIPYWLTAGCDAVARSANAQALIYLETALELLTKLPASEDRNIFELDLRSAMGIPIGAVRGVGSIEAGANFERCMNLARKFDRQREIENARFNTWLHKIARLEINYARTLADEMMAASPPDTGARLQALHSAFVSSFLSGDLDGSMRFIDEAMQFSDNRNVRMDFGLQGGHDAVSCGLGHKALILWHVGRDDEASDCSRFAMDAARALRHPSTLGHALLDALKLQVCRRAPDDALQYAEELADLAKEHSMSNYQALAQACRGWCMACQGDVEGLELLGLSFDGLRASGRLALDARLVCEYALLSERFGRDELARGVFRDALEMSRAGGSVFWLAEFERVCGKMAFLKGDLEGSEHCYRRAIEIAERQGSIALAVRSEASLVEWLLVTDRAGDAQSLLDTRTKRCPHILKSREYLAAQQLLCSNAS